MKTTMPVILRGGTSLDFLISPCLSPDYDANNCIYLSQLLYERLATKQPRSQNFEELPVCEPSKQKTQDYPCFDLRWHYVN